MVGGVESQQGGGSSRALLSGLADGAVLVASTSVGAAVVLLAARAGLSTPPLIVAECVAVLISVAFAPFLLPRSWQDRLQDLRFLVPLPGVALVLAVGLGLFLPTAMAIAFPLLALLAVVRALPILRLGSARKMLGILAGGGLLSIYLLAGMHSLPLSHALGPEFATAGWYNADAYHHLAIAQSIQSFGVPGLLADGVVPVRYHFGSHIWFAGLASISLGTPLFAYPLGQAIVLIPLLLLVLVQASLCAQPGVRRMPFDLLFVVGALVVVDALSWAGWYFSESFTLALAFLLAGLPLQTDLIEVRRRTGGLEALRIVAMYVLVLGALASKVSVGVLLGIGFGWILLRQHGISARTLALGSGLVAIALLGASLFVPARATPPDFSFLHLYVADPPLLLGHGVSVPLLVLLPSVVFFVGEGMLRWRVGKPLAKADRLRNETVGLVTLLLMIPGLFFALPALDARWFQEVAPWLVLPTLILWWSRAALRSRSASVAAAILLVFLLPLNSRLGATRFGAVSQKLQAALSAPVPPGEGAPRRRAVGLPGRPARSDLAEMAAGKRLQAMVERVRRNHPDRRLLVHLAPAVGAWVRRKSRYGCVSWSLWLPSLTGAPMLCAIGPDCSQLLFYGYSHYYGAATRTQDCVGGDLCALALERGFDTVFDIGSAFDEGKNRILDCRGEAAGKKSTDSPT